MLHKMPNKQFLNQTLQTNTVCLQNLSIIKFVSVTVENILYVSFVWSRMIEKLQDWVKKDVGA